ncbi:unnamed protein product, partial [Ixodes hexagonus]
VLNSHVFQSCHKIYGDGEFQKDSYGTDEYCSWCAEGGSLLVCDFCNRGFCKSCIRRNLSRKELSRITSLEEWNCYACDGSPVIGLVNYATMVCQFSRNLQRPQSQSTGTEVALVEKVSVEEQVKMMETMTAELHRAMGELSRVKEGEAAGSEVDVAKTAKFMREQALRLARIADVVNRSQQRKKTKQQFKDQAETSSKKKVSRRKENDDKEEVAKEEGKDDEVEAVVNGKDGLDSVNFGGEAEVKVAEVDEETVNLKEKVAEVDEETVNLKEMVNFKREEGKGDCRDADGKELPEEDTGATISLDLPEVLSLGDEFVPVAEADKEDGLVESQSLLADLFEPDLPNDAESRSTPVVLECSPGHDEESAPGTEKATAKEEPAEAAVDEPGPLHDQDTDSIVSSAEEDHLHDLPTESNKSSSDGDEVVHSTPRSDGKQQKKRSPLSKEQKARQVLMRSLRYSGDGTSDDDSDDNLPLGHRVEKATLNRRRTKRSPKKKREVEAASGVSTSVLSVLGEEWVNDPKLKAEPAVVLQRLPISCDLAVERDSEKSEEDISRLLTFPQPVRKRVRTTEKTGETSDATRKVSRKKKTDARDTGASGK